MLDANRSQKITSSILKAVFMMGMCLGLGSLAMGEEDVTQSEPTSPRPTENAQSEPDQATEATGETDSTPVGEARLKERITVVGSPDRQFEIPGSAHYLGETVLKQHRYDDAHRILRQVPGVHIQDEEGFGLRPNIGMRGTGVERSQKITLMEDGILIAPAPYSAPAAYYFPQVGRMQGIEVRKGSSAIRQGPFTTGGALNMISRQVPSDWLSGAVQFQAGRFDDQKGHVHLGGSQGQWGWFFETVQHENDGFKILDNGGDTGFEIQDYLGKLRWSSAPDAARYQSVELKLGYTEQDSDETYLGLTRDDFAIQPFRRYAGSQEDRLTTDHQTVAATWFLQLAPNWDLTTRAYRNDFSRNWRKLDSVGGVKIQQILEDPSTYDAELSWIRGDVASPGDDLLVRNNRRDYYSEGVEAILGYRIEKDKMSHTIEAGVRVHRDEEDRFQEEDAFGISSSGQMFLGTPGAPGSQANRVQSAEAVSFYLEDRITFGQWIITPGVRVEDIQFERVDFGKTDPTRTGDNLSLRSHEITQWVPGLGVSRQLGEQLSLFGSAHRGFSPPGPGATEDTRAEESWNYELGTRLRGDRWNVEATGFYNDYENLLGRDTLSSGGSGTGDLFNAGAVELYGLEAGGQVTFEFPRFSIPIRANYSYTEGTFQTSFETSFADWAPEVQAGDYVPYIPEHQAFVEVGMAYQKLKMFLASNYVSDMRTAPGQGAIPGDEGIDSRWLFDFSMQYDVTSNTSFTLNLLNLTDEVYLVSRRPAGLRPGLPRALRLGVVVQF